MKSSHLQLDFNSNISIIPLIIRLFKLYFNYHFSSIYGEYSVMYQFFSKSNDFKSYAGHIPMNVDPMEIVL